MKMLCTVWYEVGFMHCYGFIKSRVFLSEGEGGGDWHVRTWGYGVHSRLYCTCLLFIKKEAKFVRPPPSGLELPPIDLQPDTLATVIAPQSCRHSKIFATVLSCSGLWLQYCSFCVLSDYISEHSSDGRVLGYMQEVPWLKPSAFKTNLHFICIV